MLENIFIILIFTAALIYLGRNTFMAFFSKNNAGCAKGCGSCGAVDFEKISSDIEKNKVLNKP